jgi:hypothetical protein
MLECFDAGGVADTVLYCTILYRSLQPKTSGPLFIIATSPTGDWWTGGAWKDGGFVKPFRSTARYYWGWVGVGLLTIGLLLGKV